MNRKLIRRINASVQTHRLTRARSVVADLHVAVEEDVGV